VKDSNDVQHNPVSVYPFEWIRVHQATKPNGPFARSTLFELLRQNVILSKTIKIGRGKRSLRLVSLKSINAFLNGK